MFNEKDTDHRTRDCPIFLESKKKMSQKPTQALVQTTAKEVNHTSHWNQPAQSSTSNQPSYQSYNHRQEYQPNYHRYPLQYYQPYNYTPHVNQTHTPQPTISYPLQPLQITYPTANSQTSQLKTEPSNPPPPPPPPPPTNQDSQQATNFPTFRSESIIAKAMLHLLFGLVQRHLRKGIPQYHRGHATLTLSLPQDTSNLGRHIHTRQSKRRKKHRARLRSGT
jgi:hypothetical protein